MARQPVDRKPAHDLGLHQHLAQARNLLGKGIRRRNGGGELVRREIGQEPAHRREIDAVRGLPSNLLRPGRLRLPATARARPARERKGTHYLPASLSLRPPETSPRAPRLATSRAASEAMFHTAGTRRSSLVIGSRRPVAGMEAHEVEDAVLERRPPGHHRRPQERRQRRRLGDQHSPAPLALEAREIRHPARGHQRLEKLPVGAVEPDEEHGAGGRRAPLGEPRSRGARLVRRPPAGERRASAHKRKGPREGAPGSARRATGGQKLSRTPTRVVVGGARGSACRSPD